MTYFSDLAKHRSQYLTPGRWNVVKGETATIVPPRKGRASVNIQLLGYVDIKGKPADIEIELVRQDGTPAGNETGLDTIDVPKGKARFVKSYVWNGEVDPAIPLVVKVRPYGGRPIRVWNAIRKLDYFVT
jgi:hypothetical protein